MAFTDAEKQKIEDLKATGYTPAEISAYIGAERMGLTSPVHKEVVERQKPQAPKKGIGARLMDIGAAPANFLIPNSVDVFGTSMARHGIGTDTKTSVVRRFTEENTPQQIAGAVAQTGGLVAEAALLGSAAPFGLAANAALGAGFGYIYDVGDDMIEQKRLEEIITPGYATLFGATAPVALYGVGKAYTGLRGLGDDAGRVAAVTRGAIKESAPEATKAVDTAVSDVVVGAGDTGTQAIKTTAETVGRTADNVANNQTVAGVTEQVRQVANRVPRAIEATQEHLQENAARAAMREGATPAVSKAIDDGLDLKTITRVSDAPQVQKDGYAQVVARAAGDDPRTAEYVSGEYATEMYRTVLAKQQAVGKELGAARDALGTDPIDFSQHKRTLLSVLRQNNINFNPDGSVTARGKIPEQQKLLDEIWKGLREYDLDNITPQEINEIDMLLGSFERRTNLEKGIDSVYIKVPEASTGELVDQNLFRYIRDTFDHRLQQVDTTGDIKRLKSEYGNLKGITSDLNSTWYNSVDVNKSTNEDLARLSANALRRPDSRAVSGVNYSQMYNRLEVAARANGYNGPDALDISNFYIKDVEPLYKDTTPPASMTGIFGGLRQAAAQYLNVGGVTNKTKQKALEGLLDIETTVPTSVKQTVLKKGDVLEKKGIIESLKDTKGAINPRRPELTRQGVSLDKYNRLKGDALDAMDEYTTYMDEPTAFIDPEDVTRIRANAELIAEELGTDARGKQLSELFSGILKDKGRVGFNKSATTKTTDLQAGDKLYHGTPNKFKGEPNYPFYLTTDPEYAKVYQSSSASSLGVNRKTGNADVLEYEVNPKSRVLDLRTPEGEEAMKEYWSTASVSGQHVPTKSGLPDWTEGENIAEFIEENKLPFDAVLLDEGGTMSFDGVQSRGIAYQALNKNAIRPVNQTTDLLEEARKYDSADEFVKAQPVLSGRQVADEMERIGTHNGGEEWKFVLKDVANENYVKMEVPIDAIRSQDVTLRGFLGRRLEETPTKKEMETLSEGLPVLDKDGYMLDGYNRTLRAIRDGKNTMEILTPIDSKFTRTQLEDIWKKANNTGGDLLEEARKMKAEGKTFDEFLAANYVENKPLMFKGEGISKATYKLPEVIDNPALFEKYPMLRNFNVHFAKGSVNTEAAGITGRSIRLSDKLYENIPNQKKAEQLQKQLQPYLDKETAGSLTDAEYKKAAAISDELGEVEAGRKDPIGVQLNEDGMRSLYHEIQHAKQGTDGYIIKDRTDTLSENADLSTNPAYWGDKAEIDARFAETKWKSRKELEKLWEEANQ